MTEDALRWLIATGETLDVEFKGEERGPLNDRDLVEAVVCLANRGGNESGWLLVGVEDEGRVNQKDVAALCGITGAWGYRLPRRLEARPDQLRGAPEVRCALPGGGHVSSEERTKCTRKCTRAFPGSAVRFGWRLSRLEAGTGRSHGNVRSRVCRWREPQGQHLLTGSSGARPDAVLGVDSLMRGTVAGCTAREAANTDMARSASSCRVSQRDLVAQENADLHGLRDHAPAQVIHTHRDILIPDCRAGAEEPEDDGEPSNASMSRLTATLRAQQFGAAKLDAAIAADLKERGYGG